MKLTYTFICSQNIQYKTSFEWYPPSIDHLSLNLVFFGGKTPFFVLKRLPYHEYIKLELR